MKVQVVLVDFENVQKLDLARLPAHARIRIFVGAQQAKLPTALVLQAQALGVSVEWIRIEGNGPNALDFHIACHLGEGLARTPQAEFVVVSRDTGFDPLLRHLKARGLQCRREAPSTIVKAASKSALDANAQE
ncbi:MAG: PIN domain-containing protein, partial [Burkholderiales bacterium]